MNTVSRFLIGLKEEQSIQVRSVAGWIIAIIALLTALQSTFVFLFVLHSGFIRWFFLNTCSLTIFIFFIGYVIRLPLLMIVCSVFFFRYGFLGLFVFSWEGVNLFAQFGHLVMTGLTIYTLFCIVRDKAFRTLVLGVTIGIIIVFCFEIFLHEPWIRANPAVFESLLGGNLQPWIE